TNLAAAVAGSAVETAPGVLTQNLSGSMSVVAGRDLDSAYVYVADGTGELLAGRALGSARTSPQGELGSLVMMGAANVSIRARTDILLESVVNPTVLLQTAVPPLSRSTFFTYSDDASLTVES